LRRKAILGASLFLEKNRCEEKQLARGKQHARGKASCKRKINMQEEKQHGEKARKRNHDRVRVFDKGCNDYKPIE
jgi:hypothetical protein